jgi:hypothetical protein
MSTKYRLAIGAAFAIGLTASAAGLSAAPAVAAAPGQVCYFGECAPGAAPQVPAQPAAQPSQSGSGCQDSAQTISEHGSWKAVASCSMIMIVDEFDDGSKFAIVDTGGKVGIVLKNPHWHLSTGKRFVVTISVDGHEFSAMVPALDSTMIGLEDVSMDFVKALYRGHKARIQVGQESFTMTRLADAAAALDDAIRYQKRVARQS